MAFSFEATSLIGRLHSEIQKPWPPPSDAASDSSYSARLAEQLASKLVSSRDTDTGMGWMLWKSQRNESWDDPDARLAASYEVWIELWLEGNGQLVEATHSVKNPGARNSLTTRLGAWSDHALLTASDHAWASEYIVYSDDSAERIAEKNDFRQPPYAYVCAEIERIIENERHPRYLPGHSEPGFGWYHAPSDPADTVRYWDGSQWWGEPRLGDAQLGSLKPGDLKPATFDSEAERFQATKRHQVEYRKPRDDGDRDALLVLGGLGCTVAVIFLIVLALFALVGFIILNNART